ncbi:MAG: hypothetical protein EOP34_10045 [Rickettsiales bacterium]|nr:MAG: hypothetical protein EOP34_10045 [Rickettsiales bacterium]
MNFKFNHEKNIKLLEERKIRFNEIIQLIAEGNLIRITNHHNQQDYPSQKIMHIKVINQIYLVPCVIEQDGTIFLKTLFPSRKATKNYLSEIT